MAGGDTKGRVLFVQHQDDDPPGYIGERVRQRGLGVEVVRAAPGAFPDPSGYDLVVPLGSDDSASDTSVPHLAEEYDMLRRAVDADVPVFGICFGAQLLSRALGGEVRPAENGPEIGWLPVRTAEPDLIDPGPWLVWHFDVMTAPPGSVEVARTDAATQVFRQGRHLGVQFHPEATPRHAEQWSRSYSAALAELATDPESLVAEARRRASTARTKAYDLFDRFYDRIAK